MREEKMARKEKKGQLCNRARLQRNHVKPHVLKSLLVLPPIEKAGGFRSEASRLTMY